MGDPVSTGLIITAVAASAYSASKQQEATLAAADRDRMAQERQDKLLSDQKKKEENEKAQTAQKIVAQRMKAAQPLGTPMSQPVMGNTALTSQLGTTGSGKTMIGQ
jgi:hypothetical protein